jgi:SAM-dependent methyltransferase
MSLRIDLQIISDWIPDGARVLDLGCDNGALLKHLQQRGITGYGLEIDNSKFPLASKRVLMSFKRISTRACLNLPIKVLTLSFYRRLYRPLIILIFY